jgi:hypothetical protein
LLIAGAKHQNYKRSSPSKHSDPPGASLKKCCQKKHPILKKCYLIWLRQTDFDVNHPVKGFQTTSQQERQKKFQTLQLS